MRKVVKKEVRGRWVYLLGDRDIFPGDTLTIRFPDGMRESHLIHAKQQLREIKEFGEIFYVYTKELFIIIDYHGMKTFLPIEDLTASYNS
jgi:hypothetical protein